MRMNDLQPLATMDDSHRQMLSKIQRREYTVFLSHEVQSQTKLRVRTEMRTMIKLGSGRECLEGAKGGAFWGPGHGPFPHLEIGYTGVQPVKSIKLYTYDLFPFLCHSL